MSKGIFDTYNLQYIEKKYFLNISELSASEHHTVKILKKSDTWKIAIILTFDVVKNIKLWQKGGCCLLNIYGRLIE